MHDYEGTVADHARGHKAQPPKRRRICAEKEEPREGEGEKEMQIESTLNRKQADALFDAHAVFMDGEDVIFEYVAADIFGYDVMAWIEAGMKYQGYIEGGKHYNHWGDECNFFYKAGFDKMVTRHNYLISKTERSKTDGGRMWDELWAARIARIEAKEAEELRKREERKAKRTTARKAKQEATEQAVSA